jgi:hypothetical protein
MHFNRFGRTSLLVLLVFVGVAGPATISGAAGYGRHVARSASPLALGQVRAARAAVRTSRASARSTQAANFSITTSPALDPPFSPTVTNYAVRCTSSPTTTLVTTGTGRVNVGNTVLTGPVNLNLPLVAGQGVHVRSAHSNYYIRCLPADFPAYTSSVTGTPQAAGYLLTLGPYAVVFDPDGVPVWWYSDLGQGAYVTSPIDAKFITPTEISWWDASSNADVIRSLNGTVKHTVGGGATPLDFHDMQRLPNGNYLGIMDVPTDCPTDPSSCLDLSSWGLSSQASILNQVIVELNSQNKIVWQWSVMAHIDLAAANVNWHDQFPDIIHMNSIEYDGNGGIIFSARHLDAVYRIDMATGDITWKLGGSPTPQSLTVIGNQYEQLFSGQHDARLQPDGSLTVHDNGTRAGRGPRALQFDINTTTMTATVVAQVADSRVPLAICCGSVELLPTGDWVMSWGYQDFMTELNSLGVPQITITYPGAFSYREAEVTASIAALRRGMDAMVHPINGVET